MSELVASLDLGSNSFHLLLARRRGDDFETVERLKEKVQLLSGFHDGELTADAMARGHACLARFAQRLAAVPRDGLHVVGTHALREAGNRDAFAARAEAILGVPLEVVSGEEEGRLVYLGVAHHLPQDPGTRRLVVDVGGGSTELAWGGGSLPPGEPGRLASFKIGCVSLTDAHMRRETSQAVAYVAAREHALAALTGLEPVAPGMEVVGTSGTIESVQGVLAANGWGSELITRDGVSMLTDAIVSGRWLVDAGLPGLPPERVDIFAAGLAVVDALFAVLDLPAMRFVDASLQEGVLYRQVAPPTADVDLRQQTVDRLKQRYRVDPAQARRVQRTALALFDACEPAWQAGPRWRRLLGWAAELHELGVVVAPRHYHRHGAYLLQHSDLRAFSKAEQDQLTLLLRGHRRAFPGLAFRACDQATRRCLVRLLALLRIAVILHRGHQDEEAPPPAAQATGERLSLGFAPGWLDSHPLSARELEVEVGQLARAGIELKIVQAQPSASAAAARSAK